MSVFKKINKILAGVKKALKILPQYMKIKFTNSKYRFKIRFADLKLCLFDATSSTSFDRHYILHTAWASRILAQMKPIIHTDISSSLYFISIVSAFIPIKFYDYRPANLMLKEVESLTADLCDLPFPDNSIVSLSCMHVIEHIGLGRYGDSIDYDADIRAVKELQRVVALGGYLIFVVPIASEARIQFNAHRIYTLSQVVKMFDKLTLKEFTLIPDNPIDGGLILWPSDELLENQSYACGCFLFKKEELSKNQK